MLYVGSFRYTDMQIVAMEEPSNLESIRFGELTLFY